MCHLSECLFWIFLITVQIIAKRRKRIHWCGRKIKREGGYYQKNDPKVNNEIQVSAT